MLLCGFAVLSFLSDYTVSEQNGFLQLTQLEYVL